MSLLHLQCPDDKIPASLRGRCGPENLTDLDSDLASAFCYYVTSALVPSYVNVESIMGTDNEIHTHGIKSTDEIARC